MNISKDTTNEFSFILKPSEHGIGVFAVHDIKKGTYLKLFGNQGLMKMSRVMKKVDIPEIFRQYCANRENGLVEGPLDFGAMQVGWYLNHSKNCNSSHNDYKFYANQDILAGEEILIDYNTLEEPEEEKDAYYKN